MKISFSVIIVFIIFSFFMYGCESSESGGIYFEAPPTTNPETPEPKTIITIPESSFNRLFTIKDNFYYYLNSEPPVIIKASIPSNAISQKTLNCKKINNILHWKENIVAICNNYSSTNTIFILDSNLTERTQLPFPSYLTNYKIIGDYLIGYSNGTVTNTTYSPGEIFIVKLDNGEITNFNIGFKPEVIKKANGNIYILTRNNLYEYTPSTNNLRTITENSNDYSQIWISPDATWALLFSNNSKISPPLIVNLDSTDARPITLPPSSAPEYFLTTTNSTPVGFIYKAGKSYWGNITSGTIEFVPINQVNGFINFATYTDNGFVFLDKYSKSFYYYSNGITKEFSINKRPTTWIFLKNVVGGIIPDTSHPSSRLRLIRLNDNYATDYRLNFIPDLFSSSSRYLLLSGNTSAIVISLLNWDWKNFTLYDPVVTSGFWEENSFAIISNYRYGEITFGTITQAKNTLTISLKTKMGLLLNEKIEKIK